MKYLYTDLYADFECIGGECPDSCCIGWTIAVDEDTYQLYSNLENSERIISNIEVEEIKGEKRYIFKMKEDGRCPFLNDKNLCDVYIQVSPDAMCNTCKIYPRRMVQYYDAMLATVAVSCPEVARMLMDKKDNIAFGYQEDEMQADTENADWLLYNELINGLVITTELLQNKSYAFWERVYLVIDLTYKIQNHIEQKQLDKLRNAVECYRDIDFCNELLMKLPINMNSVRGCWGIIYSLFEQIECLCEDLKDKKEFFSKYKVLNKDEDETYRNWNLRFNEIADESEYEKLSVAFVFEYYMDALKGKDLFLNIVKMVLLLILIRTHELIDYNTQGKLTKEEKILTISKISRAMEHSTLLDTIAENLMKSNEQIKFYVLAYLLC